MMQCMWRASRWQVSQQREDRRKQVPVAPQVPGALHLICPSFAGRTQSQGTCSRHLISLGLGRSFLSRSLRKPFMSSAVPKKLYTVIFGL